jgi:hypothetical protein
MARMPSSTVAQSSSGLLLEEASTASTSSPSSPTRMKITTLLTACSTMAASSPPVSQTTAEKASPMANRSRKVRKSGGRWARENSAAVSTPDTTAPAAGRPIHPAIAWLR